MPSTVTKCKKMHVKIQNVPPPIANPGEYTVIKVYTSMVVGILMLCTHNYFPHSSNWRFSGGQNQVFSGYVLDRKEQGLTLSTV